MRLAILELLGAADCWYGSADFRSLLMIRSADFRMGLLFDRGTTPNQRYPSHRFMINKKQASTHATGFSDIGMEPSYTIADSAVFSDAEGCSHHFAAQICPRLLDMR